MTGDLTLLLFVLAMWALASLLILGFLWAVAAFYDWRWRKGRRGREGLI